MLPNAVDGRVGHRMQAVGDQDADIAGPGLARLLAAFDHQFAGGGAFRHARDDQGIRADDHGRADVADGDARPVRLRKALPANLQLAAGDGGGGRHLRDLGPGVG